MNPLSIAAATAAAAFIAGAPALAAHPHKAEKGAMDHEHHCGMPMGAGVVDALDVRASKATIAHEPIKSIGWDKMTMTFAVGKGVDLAAFAAGDPVHFLLKKEKGDSYSIAAMCATDAAKAAHEACMGQMHKTAMSIAEAAGAPCAMDKEMTHEDHHPDPNADGDGHDQH
jgi:Cu/Ag efflux protein CusF